MFKQLIVVVFVVFISIEGVLVDFVLVFVNVYLYIGWLNDGQVFVVGKLFCVWFGLCNMGVVLKDVKFFNIGYYYLLIDVDLLFCDQEIFLD